jgi:oligoendopeptidase F
MTFEELKPRYAALLAAPLDAAGVDAWILQWADLDADLEEEGNWLYIRCACDTENKEDEKAFLDFTQVCMPQVQQQEQALKLKLLDSGLQPEGMTRFVAGLKIDRELYREENLKIEAELAGLVAEHGKIEGAQSLVFEGREQTLQSVARFLEDKDRGLRERAWRAMMGRLGQDKEKLDQLFEAMLGRRLKLAAQAGQSGFTEYAFKGYWRMDYGIPDALKLHGTVFECMGPLARKLEAWQAQALGLGLDRLRPWDSAVDPLGDAPLKPFSGAEALFAGVKRIYARLDPLPAENLQMLWDKKLLDLESRKGKRAGGFNSGLPKSKASFILMNAVGTQQDVITLLHEGGHALHNRLSEALPNYFLRKMPIEWAEVASMTMEMLALDQMGEFYGPVEAERAKLDHLMGVAGRICRICTMDAFQHRLYAEPGMGTEARHRLYEELSLKRQSAVDWSGLETERRQAWHQVLHIFVVPFYMIEYALAQLGAMQVWEAGLKDPKAAFAGYKHALSLGAEHSLPELFAAAGAEFNPSPSRMRSLAATLEREINASLARLGKAPLPA